MNMRSLGRRKVLWIKFVALVEDLLGCQIHSTEIR